MRLFSFRRCMEDEVFSWFRFGLGWMWMWIRFDSVGWLDGWAYTAMYKGNPSKQCVSLMLIVFSISSRIEWLICCISVSDLLDDYRMQNSVYHVVGPRLGTTILHLYTHLRRIQGKLEMYSFSFNL